MMPLTEWFSFPNVIVSTPRPSLVTIFQQKCLVCLSVRRLIEGKEYQFRVLAENLYGTSDPCEESDSVLIQEAKIDIDYDKLGVCI